MVCRVPRHSLQGLLLGRQRCIHALTQLLGELPHWTSTGTCRAVAPLGAGPVASSHSDGRRLCPRSSRQCEDGHPSPVDAGCLRTGHVVLPLPPKATGHRIDGGSQLDSELSFARPPGSLGRACPHPLQVNWYLRCRCQQRVCDAGTLPSSDRVGFRLYSRGS